MLKSLITEEQIKSRIAELGSQLNERFGDEPVLMIGVLKGSFLFMADLCRYLGTNVMTDFIQVSSYDGQKSSSGVVQIRKDLDINIEGKHVVVVEDIIDTGLTLSHLCQVWRTRNPKSLTVVTFLSKPEARLHELPVDFVGFEIPNAFVVGYGLDYEEKYRNLPYVAQLVDDPVTT
ncbi:MAG: hypoxanthine phosphoribosyltransferase [Armatimonadetes bacterium]|nr:hypoxanthine phosphoribosyltransferase [Armatimonadota bacterium]